jgi:predicted glycoside hydrolase/deacetylase ChbG (UPF0249 family)
MGLTSARPLAVVVTADDFGIGVETSRGIIDAHLHGPVTATSLMTVTGDHVKASVPLLADAPDLDVGLHLVLTNCGEKPLVAGRSSGLVDRDGRFFSNGKLWIRSLAGRLDRAGAADEISAQAELFHKLVGRVPDYVDGHHHAHQLPTIRDAVLDVIGRGLLPAVTRCTIEPPGLWRHVSSARARRAAAGWMGHRARSAWQGGQGVWTNDTFFGMLDPADFSRPFPWDRYLANLPAAGVVEWVVHPGRGDESLVGRDDYRAERAIELAAFTSPGGVAAWSMLKPVLARKSILAARANEAGS